jgi:hypothetical protein
MTVKDEVRSLLFLHRGVPHETELLDIFRFFSGREPTPQEVRDLREVLNEAGEHGMSLRVH